MKNSALLLLIAIGFSSCKSAKNSATITSPTAKVESHPINLSLAPILTIAAKTIEFNSLDLHSLVEIPKPVESRATRIVDYAFAFDGVKYKRGGTTKEGMDCSGLVVTTFNRENISLPRSSREIALTGNSVDLKDVDKGDLLFFATRRNSKTISHVGIVTTARDGFVEFIHASTSSGVIVSNMAEKYWHFAFIKARRVI